MLGGEGSAALRSDCSQRPRDPVASTPPRTITINTLLPQFELPASFASVCARDVADGFFVARIACGVAPKEHDEPRKGWSWAQSDHLPLSVV